MNREHGLASVPCSCAKLARNILDRLDLYTYIIILLIFSKGHCIFAIVSLVPTDTYITTIYYLLASGVVVLHFYFLFYIPMLTSHDLANIYIYYKSTIFLFEYELRVVQ